MTVQRATVAPVAPAMQDKIDFARQKQKLARNGIRKILDRQWGIKYES